MNHIDSDLKTFLLECMKENLNHARHIEMEIHTFTGIYMAVAAGVLAFDFSTAEVSTVVLGLYSIMLCAGVIAVLLLNRWYSSFDNHMGQAKAIYRYLSDLYFSDGIEKPPATFDGEGALFVFKHPRNRSPLRTRHLVYGFHYIIILAIVFIFIKDIILI